MLLVESNVTRLMHGYKESEKKN